jgi:hypothetical protein
MTNRYKYRIVGWRLLQCSGLFWSLPGLLLPISGLSSVAGESALRSVLGVVLTASQSGPREGSVGGFLVGSTLPWQPSLPCAIGYASEAFLSPPSSLRREAVLLECCPTWGGAERSSSLSEVRSVLEAVAPPWWRRFGSLSPACCPFAGSGIRPLVRM